MTLLVVKEYIELLQECDEPNQDELKQLWQQSNLEQAIGPLETLDSALNETKESL